MQVTAYLLLSCIGFFTVQGQTCGRPPAGPHTTLSDNDIVKETFNDGERATFNCETGYTPIGGVPYITCSGGTWNNLSLRCGKKSCGPIEEKPNLEITYGEDTDFGSKVVITCKEGYRLIGRPGPVEIVCGDKGWMDRVPECEVVTCEPPQSVADSTLSPEKEIYNYNEVIKYSCKGDLVLNGSDISCGADGFFHPDPPSCIKVQCEDIQIPNGQWVSGSRPPHRYMSSVTFRCDTGFRMVASPTMMCGIDSRWSPAIPKCEPVTCVQPPMIENGAFTPNKDLYEYKEDIQYSCQTDFRLSGSSRVSCSSGGTFQPQPPTCIPVTCGRPPTIENGAFSPRQESYNVRDVVQYSCQTGFTLRGSDSLSCSSDGTFKPDAPTCILKTCGLPPTIKNGAFTPNKQLYQYNDVVQYSCQPGFTLRGSDSLLCSSDGTFKPDAPKCIRSVIPPTTTTKSPPDCHCKPLEIQNAEILSPRLTYKPKDRVTFKCKDEYEMKGEPTLECQPSCQWSPSPPECNSSISVGTQIGIAFGCLAGLALLAYLVKKVGWDRYKNKSSQPLKVISYTELQGTQLSDSSTSW